MMVIVTFNEKDYPQVIKNLGEYFKDKPGIEMEFYDQHDDQEVKNFLVWLHNQMVARTNSETPSQILDRFDEIVAKCRDLEEFSHADYPIVDFDDVVHKTPGDPMAEDAAWYGYTAWWDVNGPGELIVNYRVNSPYEGWTESRPPEPYLSLCRAKVNVFRVILSRMFKQEFVIREEIEQ